MAIVMTALKIAMTMTNSIMTRVDGTEGSQHLGWAKEEIDAALDMEETST